MNTTSRNTPLIGRALQFEALQNILADVQGGRGHCVLVTGEAGVGKSRLLDEFRRDTAMAGLVVMQGNCFEPDLALPFAPLMDAVRRFFGPNPPENLRRLLEPLAPELVKLLPELTLVFPNIAPSPPLSPEAEKQRLFETLVLLFTRLASDAPLLLVVEDIHWSDETTLEFLHLLARRLHALPVFLLLATRPEAESEPLNRFLTYLNRDRLARKIHLQPLSPDAVEALLRAMFAWDHPLDPLFLRSIYTLTEGIPFFVEEVASALVVRGDISFVGGRWSVSNPSQLHIPRSLRLVVHQYTDRLSPDAAELLALAAVAGRRFDFDVLARLAPYDEPRLLALIKELVAARLVIEESADIFTFRHTLTREAVYTSLLHRERRHWHKAIASFYEQQPGEQNLPQLAYHYYKAGQWEKALHYNLTAGTQALNRFAPHAALTHFDRAANAAGQAGQPLPPELFRMRGQARQMVGSFAAAQADFDALLETAQRNGDRLAEWQALHHLGFLWMARDYSRMGQYLQQALDLARHLDDPHLLAQSLNRLGNWEANIGRPRQALARHQEALAIFETAQDQGGIAATLDLIGTVHGITGNTAGSVANYRRAIAIFEALDDRQGLASSLAMLATGGFIEAGERALEIARKIGWRDGQANAHIRLSLACLDRGDLGAGLDHARRALEIAREIEHLPWQTAASFSLGIACRLMLSLSEAEEYLTQALALARGSGAELWANGILYPLIQTRLEAGKVQEAVELLPSPTDQPASMETLTARFVALARGKIALAQNQPETALEIVSAVLSAVPELPAWQERTLPDLRHLQGQAWMALGEWEKAETALTEALNLYQARAFRSLSWQVQADLARLYLQQGNRPAADAVLTEANQLLDELAATIPHPDLRREFRKTAAARLPALPGLTSLQQSKQAFGGLTRRERQVAILVAQGKSNPEIAAELFITVRTTKTHITNILTKLNFSSRSQIAVWVVEKGLLERI